MVDLDSNPTKLIEIVEIGAASDDARRADRFPSPTMWPSICHHPGDVREHLPVLNALNIMHLKTPGRPYCRLSFSTR
jgi:high-affinity K+ transport system ATPase subunit B